MAANSPVATHTSVGRGAHLYTWAMIDDSTAVAVSVPVAADKSIQLAGTFDSSTYTVQGSNDGTNWATLTDIDGSTALSALTASIHQIEENTVWIRVVEASGLGSVAVTASLLVRNG